MGGPVVRAAEDADLPAVARLRWDWIAGEGGAATDLDRAGFVAAFTAWARGHAGTHRCFVVAVDDVVVGAGWLAWTDRVPSPRSFERRTCDVQSVIVDPAHRGRGAGTALVARLVAEARASGAERVVVHSSPRAVPLYDRAGFAASERLRDVDLRSAPTA